MAEPAQHADYEWDARPGDLHLGPHVCWVCDAEWGHAGPHVCGCGAQSDGGDIGG